MYPPHSNGFGENDTKNAYTILIYHMGDQNNMKSSIHSSNFQNSKWLHGRVCINMISYTNDCKKLHIYYKGAVSMEY